MTDHPSNNNLNSLNPYEANAHVYDDLNLSFGDFDDMEDGVVNRNFFGDRQQQQQQQQQRLQFPSQQEQCGSQHASYSEDLKKPSFDDVSCGKGMPRGSPAEEEYILGTLIVRVAGARNLSVEQGGGGGLFSLDSRAPHLKNRNSLNPYASVRFGSTTQRTSQVFGTADPSWPRGESMFLDVIQRAWKPLQSEKISEDCHDIPKDQVTKMHSSSSSLNASAEAPVKSKMMKALTTPVDHKRPKPMLSIAVFHSSHQGKINKKLGVKNSGGDSDDQFLGMVSRDMTQLITGKMTIIDEWLPLTGSNSENATVRIVCEYEATDSPPGKGDVVSFTDYCHPMDIHPLRHGCSYTVEETHGDNVVIQHTTPERWVTTFLVHRHQLICNERHQGVMDFYHQELASLTQRLAHSPMIHAVQETVQRVPDDGIVTVGKNAVQGALGLLGRWMEGGLATAVEDVAVATNWDGRFNPDLSNALSEAEDHDQDATVNPEADTPTGEASSVLRKTPLPNMPACPITGEPMLDPVVAADGHTYERSAIARWLQTSDKSPLTGAILPHKNLVPNYMLLSSLQETAASVEPEARPAVASIVAKSLAVSSLSSLPGEEEEEETGEQQQQQQEQAETTTKDTNVLD